jgi:hypothetical protein
MKKLLIKYKFYVHYLKVRFFNNVSFFFFKFFLKIFNDKLVKISNLQKKIFLKISKIPKSHVVICFSRTKRIIFNYLNLFYQSYFQLIFLNYFYLKIKNLFLNFFIFPSKKRIIPKTLKFFIILFNLCFLKEKNIFKRKIKKIKLIEDIFIKKNFYKEKLITLKIFEKDFFFERQIKILNLYEKEFFCIFIPQPLSNSKKIKFIFENERKDTLKKKKIFKTFKKNFYFHEKLFEFTTQKKQINETNFIKNLWIKKFEKEILKF